MVTWPWTNRREIWSTDNCNQDTWTTPTHTHADRQTDRQTDTWWDESRFSPDRSR